MTPVCTENGETKESITFKNENGTRFKNENDNFNPHELDYHTWNPAEARNFPPTDKVRLDILIFIFMQLFLLGIIASSLSFNTGWHLFDHYIECSADFPLHSIQSRFSNQSLTAIDKKLWSI